MRPLLTTKVDPLTPPISLTLSGMQESATFAATPYKDSSILLNNLPSAVGDRWFTQEGPGLTIPIYRDGSFLGISFRRKWREAR